MFTLRRLAPHPALRDLIETYYVLECDVPEGTAFEDTMLPTLPILRVCLTGDLEVDLHECDAVLPPRATLMGFTNYPYKLRSHGPSRMFGIGIKPLGWHRLFGVSAAEAADKVLDLESFLGFDISSCVEALEEATKDSTLVRVADSAMLQLAERSDGRLASTLRSLDRVLSAGDITRVDELAAALGLSVRQVERATQQLYGCSPKLLLRKHRFLAMLNRSRDKQERWFDQADETIYDQSHYIREFKRFTGRSPGEYYRRPSSLQQKVMTPLTGVTAQSA